MQGTGGRGQAVGGQGGWKFITTQMAPKWPRTLLDRSLGTVVCAEEGGKESGTRPEPVGSLIKTTGPGTFPGFASLNPRTACR